MRLQMVSAVLVVAFSLSTLDAADKPADLVVVNAHVITVHEKSPEASAVAIGQGNFVAVGSDAEVRKWIGDQTRVIDAQGKTVIPGLIETHVHAVGVSQGEVQQPFVQLRSIAEIQDWVRREAARVPLEKWIQAPRVDVTRIQERRIPNRADLDLATPDHPVVFNWQYANRQIQVLNSAALRAAGITKDTAAPPRGKVHLGPDGEPDGVLENCGELLTKFLPRRKISGEEHLASLEQLIHHYNAVGITSIFERNTNVDGYRIYEKLKAAGRLAVRVTTTIGLGSDGTVAGTERAIQSLPFRFGEGDEWLRVGPLKIGVDGGVLYGTAFMRDPYGKDAFSLYGISDPNYRGDLRFTPEQLKNMIRTGHRLGWQMCSHVTGDAGVDAVLDAVAAADADSPIRERRYTLIHAYFPSAETAQRAARLGVCVDTQPAWYYKDGDALASALGSARLSRFIGLSEWRRAGVKVALNSDHMQGFDPVTSLNPYHPFLTMYVAVTRKTETGLVIGPEQRVGRAEALRMMTLDAAYLGFDEDRKGSIAVGKLGDLAILTDDPLTCEESKIKDIRALVTVVGGRVVLEEKLSAGK